MFSILRRPRFEYTPLASNGGKSEDSDAVNAPQTSTLTSLGMKTRTQTVLHTIGCVFLLFALYVTFYLLDIRKVSVPQQDYLPVKESDDATVHPIQHLVAAANAQFSSIQHRQSKTLRDAVHEYQRRYGMPPPPHFDRWYEFATQRGSQVIDDFDEVIDSLSLFWGMEPHLIRRRTREILGHDDSLMGATIRNGQVNIFGQGQGDFQAIATQEMLAKFSRWLPDMDIAFNVNDEPRVLVPHEDVEGLHSAAVLAKKSVKPKRYNFTISSDLGDGKSFEPVAESHFNQFDRQQTFTHARMSCPPDSPARSFDLDLQKDEDVGVEFEGLTFIDNITTFSDICLSPSVRKSIGVFNHPNALSVSHDLLPIFSPSKLSTFHDILYPSPYNYAEKTKWEESDSIRWSEKVPKLYWRGATSGGYSENGNWHYLLRQSVLSKLRPNGTTQILLRDTEGNTDGSNQWRSKSIDREMVAHRYDTEFTEIKQCAIHDCAEMQEFFGSHPLAPQQEAWKSRYLLDMDGNALSGRFYALLQSLSLPLKVAYFREWHVSRIIPWKHYGPLTATTDEYDEILRFFEEEDKRREIAERIALEGHEWTAKVLRKEDMEVYMFRLLLEYARVVDDDRLNLGLKL